MASIPVSVLGATEQEMDDLAGRLGQLRQRLEELVRRNATLEEQIKSERDTRVRFGERNVELVTEGDELRRRIAELEGERGRLVTENQELSRRVGELRTELLEHMAKDALTRIAQHEQCQSVVINVQRADDADAEVEATERKRAMCPYSRRGCYGQRCVFWTDAHPSGCILAVEGWEAAHKPLFLQ